MTIDEYMKQKAEKAEEKQCEWHKAEYFLLFCVVWFVCFGAYGMFQMAQTIIKLHTPLDSARITTQDSEKWNAKPGRGKWSDDPPDEKVYPRWYTPSPIPRLNEDRVGWKLISDDEILLNPSYPESQTTDDWLLGGRSTLLIKETSEVKAELCSWEGLKTTSTFEGIQTFYCVDGKPVDLWLAEDGTVRWRIRP